MMARPKKTPDHTPTVSVSLRIDPRIKYGIDLAARIQKRTVTGVVEWAVENALADIQMPTSVFRELESPDAATDLASHLDDILWSTNEGVRLVLLASRYPSLLTYDETLIWETIKLSPPFWRFLPSCAEDCTPWENARLDIVSECWEKLVEIVNSRKEISSVSYAELGLSDAYKLTIEKASELSTKMYELSLSLIYAGKNGKPGMTEEERAECLEKIESMQKQFDGMMEVLRSDPQS